MPYRALEHRLGLTRPLPYTPKWSAAPDFLGLIAENCLSEKPAIIVECSSGTSTLVLARCCQINGQGHVYSLENDEQFAVATTRQLEAFGLGEYASVIHAPLVEYVLNGNKYDWYNMEKLNVTGIDMLVIDGPPAYIKNEARYPALPMLHDRLNRPCSIFLDDANRAGEQLIVQHWAKTFAELRGWFVENKRGCFKLEWPLET